MGIIHGYTYNTPPRQDLITSCKYYHGVCIHDPLVINEFSPSTHLAFLWPAVIDLVLQVTEKSYKLILDPCHHFSWIWHSVSFFHQSNLVFTTMSLPHLAIHYKLVSKWVLVAWCDSNSSLLDEDPQQHCLTYCTLMTPGDLLPTFCSAKCYSLLHTWID